MALRRIVSVREDEKGRNIAFRFQGNAHYTPLRSAIKLAEKGLIENAHVVKRGRRKHLRSNPDQDEGNNLDEMASY